MSNASHPTWKVVLTAVLDFLTVFFMLGYVISLFTGERSAQGFQLEGWSALLLFALVVAYFVLARRMGGTLWQRILGTRN
ncbi:MAG: hypothetical protein ACK4LQ_11400 [Pararhodobacter sp.]